MSSAQTRIISLLFEALEKEHNERTGHWLNSNAFIYCEVCWRLREIKEVL